jgi:hypothetical protein
MRIVGTFTPRVLSRQTVGNVGLFYVCFKLSQLGWNVMPTARNAKGIDLLAYNEDASRVVTVQVKSLSDRVAVPLGKTLNNLLAEYVVICTNVGAEIPESFVLTSSGVRSLALWD